jgi:hypothetical protein
MMIRSIGVSARQQVLARSLRAGLSRSMASSAEVSGEILVDGPVGLLMVF